MQQEVLSNLGPVLSYVPEIACIYRQSADNNNANPGFTQLDEMMHTTTRDLVTCALEPVSKVTSWE